MSTRPANIVLIITDHQRADSIGMVQCGHEVTPHLNRLAREGACFNRAYTTSPLCIPARTALATGLYPTRNGVTINDFSPDAGTPNTLISQRLFDAGYAVAQIGKHDIRCKPPVAEQPPPDPPRALWMPKDAHHAYLHERGLNPYPGDDPDYRERYYREVTEPLADGDQQRRYSMPSSGVWEHPLDDFRDPFFYRAARDWLDTVTRNDQPFALMLSLPSPHPPLIVPEPYASMFPPEAIDLPANVDMPSPREPSNRARCVARQLADGVEIDTHRRAWAAHLGLVRLADDMIGNVLADLERLGVADDTAVICTSDHGHHLGQHRMFGINELYEQTVHVPLVMRMPSSRVADAPPRQFDRLVSHLDLAPTMLELAGMPTPDDMPGLSLVDPIASGELPSRHMFLQFSGQIGKGETRRGVVTPTHKYIFDPDSEAELYDLVSDPLEMYNMADDPIYGPVQRDLHAACRAWHIAQHDWVNFD